MPLFVGMGGILLAYLFYMFVPNLPVKLSMQFSSIYKFLLNKWYFDEIYDRIFVKQSFMLGRGFWKSGDGALIDGVGPDGIALSVRNLAKRAAALQTGFVYHYAFAILLGVTALLSWVLIIGN